MTFEHNEEGTPPTTPAFGKAVIVTSLVNDVVEEEHAFVPFTVYVMVTIALPEDNGNGVTGVITPVEGLIVAIELLPDVQIGELKLLAPVDEKVVVEFEQMVDEVVGLRVPATGFG